MHGKTFIEFDCTYCKFIAFEVNDEMTIFSIYLNVEIGIIYQEPKKSFTRKSTERGENGGCLKTVQTHGLVGLEGVAIEQVTVGPNNPSPPYDIAGSHSAHGCGCSKFVNCKYPLGNSN